VRDVATSVRIVGVLSKLDMDFSNQLYASLAAGMRTTTSTLQQKCLISRNASSWCWKTSSMSAGRYESSV